jgi:hypothetical protein
MVLLAEEFGSTATYSEKDNHGETCETHYKAQKLLLNDEFLTLISCLQLSDANGMTSDFTYRICDVPESLPEKFHRHFWRHYRERCTMLFAGLEGKIVLREFFDPRFVLSQKLGQALALQTLTTQQQFAQTLRRIILQCGGPQALHEIYEHHLGEIQYEMRMEFPGEEINLE